MWLWLAMRLEMGSNMKNLNGMVLGAGHGAENETGRGDESGFGLGMGLEMKFGMALGWG